MKPRVRFTKVWSDDDIIELTVEVSDGRSSFLNEIYVPTSWPEEAAASLQVFRTQIYGGLHDMELGKSGPKYASGAFSARLHFQVPEILYISTYQQAEHVKYKTREEAAEARFFLKTEPVLLDRFIEELKSMSRGAIDGVTLECA